MALRKRTNDGFDYGSEVVTVVVGEGDSIKAFPIHKALLVKHSDFFASAFKSGSCWKENEESRMEIKDDTPEVFDVFFRFLYSGKIFTMKDGDLTVSDQGNTDKEWPRLRDCWIMGEKLLSNSFKDAITDALIEKVSTDSKYPLSIHEGIFLESGGQVGMRKLLVDLATWYWTAESISRSNGQGTEFFFQVALAMKKLRPTDLTGKAPFEKEDTCIYHDHGESSACYKTMF